MITELADRSRQASKVDAASQNSPLRVAVVGAGLMGRWHARAIDKAGGRVVAVADLDIGQAQRLAKRFSAESFSDGERMLTEVELDVLHICSPSSTHGEIGELAISAGLNLLIEKPITPSAAQTANLYDQAARRKVLVCPVHQFVFQNGVAKARKLLSRVGSVVHLAATICSAGGKGLVPDQLDSIVADVLPHPLSLMQKFLPGNLHDDQWQASRPSTGELRVSGEAMGVTLSIFISMNARPPVCEFQIVGTEGTIHLNLFHGYAYLEPGRVSRMSKITHPFEQSMRNFLAATSNLGLRVLQQESAYPGLQRLVNSFYEALRKGGPAPISADETIAIARVRDSLVKSVGMGLQKFECPD